jgi:ammonia channel protein AmtB
MSPESLKELITRLGDLRVAVDTVWVLVAAVLVFFMNLGFAAVESGFCRAKNTVTILAKNFIVFAVASIAFLGLGFGLMFGDGPPWVGTQGLWFLAGADNSPATGDASKGVYAALNWTGVPLWGKFFFQLVFAGTAATIVSGAVAERVRFGAFSLFSFAMVGLIYYPVIGHWIWGGGWLQEAGMWEFAGSTVVHSVDDPVGAISVHLVCGAFGTLTLGLFAQDAINPNTTGDGLLFGGGVGLLLAHLLGVVSVGIFVIVAAFLGWGLLAVTLGIRVPADEELAGLDVGEHGISAYPEFHAPDRYAAPGARPASTAAPRLAVAAPEQGR